MESPTTVYANHDDATLVVYQAFSPAIADAALAAHSFVPPFRRDRMTWIKPSFLWMMYRSAWASARDQERVLAVRMTLDGWWWALRQACLSSYSPAIHASFDEWREELSRAPVRVQWDPERSLTMQRLERRAIQVGLAASAVTRYVDDWIVDLNDVTELAHEIHSYVGRGDLEDADALLPCERPLALPADIARRLVARP